jgi:hypothetical protein
VEQFTLTANNNAEFIQADNSVTPYDVVLGRLEVSGSFTYLLQNDADYRRFHTGQQRRRRRSRRRCSRRRSTSA